MRRALATLLLAAAALSTGVALPPPQPPRARERPVDPFTPLTECNLLKSLFCNKANQLAENNQLRTWKTFDQLASNHNEHVDRTQDVRYDDALKDTRTWTYPSQFGRLQRGFGNPYEPPYEFGNLRYYGNTQLPKVRMVYLRNKDIVIENDEPYYVYDSYIANTNPFDILRVRVSCRAAQTSAPPNYDGATAYSDTKKLEELENEETNEINPLVTKAVEKREDFWETGQKEIPDNLIFSNEENGDVQKKLFALWSRMQSLTPKGRKLPARRHAFVLYGRDGALSAETRAARLRPPGQPLRWG